MPKLISTMEIACVDAGFNPVIIICRQQEEGWVVPH
jgi:hypothetical protein